MRKNKLKVASISDFTTDRVEVEIKLPRGVTTDDVVDALYAFTDCEISISVNLLVIKDRKPVQMTITEVMNYYALQLVDVLIRELKLEEKNLRARLHAKTLEQIFIEERIYKKIEQMKTHESVIRAVITGFEPFHHLIKNEVTEEDVERLLKIPIRRISLYDINKSKKEMEEIIARLREIKYHLAHIKEYALSFVAGIKEKYGASFNRNTEITSFQKVDFREAAIRNLKLRYDKDTGYLGYEVASGESLFEVSVYDRVLVIKKNGTYLVMNAPDRVFIDKGMLYCALAEKEQMSETVFTILYKSPDNKGFYIKRCSIEQYILDKAYDLIPENCKLIFLTTKTEGQINLGYAPKPRVKILEESFDVSQYLVKGIKAGGVRLTTRDVKSCKFVSGKKKAAKS